MWWTWKEVNLLEFKVLEAYWEFYYCIINMGMQSKPDNGLVGKPVIFEDVFSKERCQYF